MALWGIAHFAPFLIKGGGGDASRHISVDNWTELVPRGGSSVVGCGLLQHIGKTTVRNPGHSTMRWHAPFALLLALLSQTGAFQTPDTFSNSLDGDFIQKDPQNLGPDRMTPDGIDETMRFLAKLLVLPWPDGALPILYVERPDQAEGEEMTFEGQDQAQQVYQAGTKRSRYYRKYPWKRQNSRYDPTNPYICNPSKDEVYRLLVALHEARQGNRDKTVDFCNRKRPAYAVYTNIRFLGK